MNKEENEGMMEIQQWVSKYSELSTMVVGRATSYVDHLNFGADATESLAELRRVLGEFWAHHRAGEFPQGKQS